jgi:4-amino-4-deoxy-L-arabinose transferase-like glycosyltransferase
MTQWRTLAGRPRLLWSCAIGVSLLLSIFAALRGGYIGPDYQTHLTRLTEWPKVFDFSTPEPPAYYLLGHALFRLIGSNNAFPITLSILQAAINALAIWYFFRYIEVRFESPLIHLALVLFLTFLPVRVIHAVTIGTDALTIPCFVLVLFVFDRFLNDESARPQNAVFLGMTLGLTVWVKYSFIALVPAIFVLFICLWRKRRWKLNRFIVISALALTLPSALALYSFRTTTRLQGYYTQLLWLPKGVEADMNLKDLLSVKKNDLQLFTAPEYFKKQILAAHKHSYLALSHLGIFTDTMNLFQHLAVPQRFESILIPDQKIRQPWKTCLMQASMSLGVLWTVLALIGTPWTLFRGLEKLWKDKLEREDATAFLGIAYFLLMFLPIPFVYNGDLFGYWTPRLILPALLYFFQAAFLSIDRKIATRYRRVAFPLFVLVVVQCLIEIVMLA